MSPNSMLTMITVPTASSIMSSSSEYFSTMSGEFMPFVWISVGIIAAVAMILLLKNAFFSGLSHLSNMTVSKSEKESKAGSWEASRAMYELHNK